MAWKIKWEDVAFKQLSKLDKQIEKRIVSYLEKVVQNNPRKLGKRLNGDKSHLWRFRTGDYRIICRIVDDEFIVLVIAIGHRKEIYNQI